MADAIPFLLFGAVNLQDFTSIKRSYIGYVPLIDDVFPSIWGT